MEGYYSFPSVLRRTRRPPAPSPRRAKSIVERSLPPVPNILGCLILRPTDVDYAKYLPVYNLRTARDPAIRAVCRTPSAVAGILDWARTSNVPFSVRGGGHSFEGYCNNTRLVIDLRNLKSIDFDEQSRTVTVGAGVVLGDVYAALKNKNAAFVAGTCPTVGVSGHVLGGGYGFLSRAHGLACDNLLTLSMVDATGKIVVASATSNADLFWASRGGGGGSLGIATAFTFATHPISAVSRFLVVWSIADASRAARVIDAWQAWAPQAPDEITALLKVGKNTNGKFALRCVGLSRGTPADLRRELAGIVSVETPAQPIEIETFDFYRSTQYFGGTGNDFGTLFQKEKSDYVATLSASGIAAALAGLTALPSGQVVLILNAYGGALGRVPGSATAFPHRADVRFLMHYYSQWGSGASTASRLARIRTFYESMRPYVLAGKYANYCDADLGANYPTAYWGGNLARLKAIKRAYDPNNLFHFDQSIPI